MKHTPLPWHYDDYRIWAGADEEDGPSHLIASLKFGRLADNVDEDGAYIVRACNEFPAMLEALREMYSWIEDGFREDEKPCELVADTRAILARLEGVRVFSSTPQETPNPFPRSQKDIDKPEA